MDLDDPVASALWGDQAALALGTGRARRFPPDIGPLAALTDQSQAALRDLADLVRAHGRVALLRTATGPQVPGLEIVSSSPGVQMVHVAQALVPAGSYPAPIALGEADWPDMLALASETAPGPFAARTGSLGPFYGVRGEDGRLLAMAGQRLRPGGHVELSGVCTHPSARGRGLAARLSLRVMADILAESRTPILHAYADRTAALALYERLGFRLRCPVTMTVYAVAG